ncbi:MAG: hypothetical protein GY795_40695 [Desulfobacterales bacterium]|nr:hypothetical protein [Desulfobacterales bacterium]
MKKKKTALWVLVMFLLLPASSYGSGKWELVKKTGKIKVYRRSVKGYDVDEFKGVSDNNARIEVIGIVLEDIPAYKEWLEYMSESRVIRKIDEDNMIIYQGYNTMWPFHDRDCLVKINIKKDFNLGKIYINMNSINEPDVPLRKKTVRITELTGRIVLEYIDREHTRVEYVGRFNFGGSIPAWQSNMLSREIPFRMLDRLGKQVKKKKYKQAAERSEYKKKIEESIKKWRVPKFNHDNLRGNKS